MGTRVNSNGNTFDIEGGQTSGNNLFHSFEEFGLDAGQTANFIADPNIENILGRITGGDPSLINGSIQSDANLFLMNPAGIVFGSGASLNVAGDFTATTATGIGFGDSWFSAIGDNNWSELVGNPTGFEFATTNPGSIVNEGNLAVANGNLNLFGGTVVNTGELSAPGGNINVTAVPGEDLVRLSADGNLLSLDVAPQTNPLDFTPLSLPQLLTGGNVENASQIVENPNGSISLTGSNLEIPAEPGTVALGGTLEADNLNVKASGDILVESITFEGNGDAIVLEADIDGDGMGLFEAVEAIDTNGRHLEISAASITLANVRSDGGNITLDAEGDVEIFRVSSAAGDEGDAGDIDIQSHGGSIISDSWIIANADRGDGGQITLRADGDLILDRNGDPNEIQPSVATYTHWGEGGDIHLVSENGNIEVNARIRSVVLEEGNSGNITIEAPNGEIALHGKVASQSHGTGDAGTIDIQAQGDIITADLDTYVRTFGGDGGDVSVRTSEGSITINAPIFTSTIDGKGGDVTLEAASDISLQEVWAGTVFGEAGDISILSGGGITMHPGEELLNALRTLLDYVEDENLCADGGVSCNADGSITLTPSEMTPETLAKLQFSETLGSSIEIIAVEGVLPVDEPEIPEEETETPEQGTVDEPEIPEEETETPEQGTVDEPEIPEEETETPEQGTVDEPE
ncbi:MAG: filamentous hemagglutinin N-terminal domain-containing protein, partial [Cyanobacteriota bacterium]|nr:filamentous hemagglutinin N-terminal domain-containing protein [Cyanobacteriota bacterium]